MVRILIPALILCASLAPAAEPTVAPVPAETPAVTCPLGKTPACEQPKADEQGKGQCLRKRDGGGCQGKGAGQGKGRRDGSCKKEQAGNG